MPINRNVDGGFVADAQNITAATTTTHGTLTGMADYKVISFLLKVDSASGHSAAGDKVTVYFQRTGNNGSTWDDIAASTQWTENAVGDGGTKYEWITIVADTEPGSSDDVYTEAAASLAAATTKDLPWGDSIRIQSTGVEGADLDMTIRVSFIAKN